MASTSLRDLKAASTQPQLPLGIYDWRIVNATARKSKGGKDQILAQCEVIAGPHAGVKEGLFLTVSPESQFAVKIFFGQLRVLGIDDAMIDGGIELAQIAETIKGRYFTATISYREVNGAPQVNFADLTAYAGQPQGPTPTPQAQQYAPAPPAGQAPPQQYQPPTTPYIPPQQQQAPPQQQPGFGPPASNGGYAPQPAQTNAPF